MADLVSPEAITSAISFAREEAKRLGVDVNVILKCWATGFNAAAIVEFAKERGWRPRMS